MRIQICLHVTRYICNTVTSGRGVEDAGAGRKKKQMQRVIEEIKLLYLMLLLMLLSMQVEQNN